jgi:thymidylate synthase (FAD)
MKLIKPSFTIIEQGSGIEGVYKQIEMAGRTCYKSEDKITETSAKEFVDRMIKSGHGAMLEHGTVYLFANWYENEGGSPLGKYKNNKYSRYTWNDNGAYVTTNLRVLVENGWMDDLKYLSIPTEYHARRITVKFVCDRGVTHEFVRHRVFSFAQESTRYCNYSKDKFGNNVTYIIPCWTKTKECEIDTSQPSGFTAEDEWICMLGKAERHYFRLINMGWKAQEARAVLPTAVKAELVMTGFVDDWKHFFHLRTAAGAHPQARELAQPLQEEFERRNYID